MTDNEIISVLDKCASKCMRYEDSERMGLYKSTLDLINRQKATIERAERNFTAVKVDVKLKNKEIERLQKERQLINEDLTNALTKMRALREDIKIAKSEAIKEFAERLKKEFEVSSYSFAYFECKIDNLVKEMEGK